MNYNDELHDAIRRIRPRKARRLLDEGIASVKAINCGKTPLKYAVNMILQDIRTLEQDEAKGRFEILDILLAAGAAPKTPGWLSGLMGFTIAAATAPVMDQLLGRLLAKGATLNTRNKEGHPPLYAAMKHQQAGWADALLRAGANPLGTSRDGRFAYEAPLDWPDPIPPTPGCPTEQHMRQLHALHRLDQIEHEPGPARSQRRMRA